MLFFREFEADHLQITASTPFHTFLERSCIVIPNSHSKIGRQRAHLKSMKSNFHSKIPFQNPPKICIRDKIVKYSKNQMPLSHYENQ